MTNRLAVALAVTAGYVLGRTKKAKLAIGVGSMVLGKRLNLSPQQLLGTLSDQMKANPQLAEVRDQLGKDLRGVGKAATNALVTRQLDSFADRLHDRTLDVRDRIDTGRLTGGPADGRDAHEGEDRAGDESEDRADEKPGDDAYEARGKDEAGREGPEQEERPRRKRPAKKAAGKKAAARKAPAKKAAAAKKTAGAAKRTATRRMGGGDRD
ncbi:DNA primase [Streptomyces sp. 8N706]|uniref:DNA primase n=1 Tax=Streptomyces sp. 8N706 TaxID=3457416 RepID=UPI003FD32ACA